MNDATRQQNPLIERVEGDLMAVNSYLVHGPEGMVVVDGQLTVADATKVRAAVEATGRPLAAVLLTHPHPDHYAGAAIIAGDAPIVATPDVAAVIRRDDEAKSAIVGSMMGEQWPAQRRFPDLLVDPGDVVELGGLGLRVEQLGAGESHADTLWWLDGRTVFAGDVAYHDMHAYLADARHRNWLASLTALDARLPADVTLHIGHGTPTDRGVLAAQRRYIEAFLDVVAAHADADPQARRSAVLERMREIVADERLLFLMELSIEPVLASLTGVPE